LRTQLVSAGHTKELLAGTDRMIHIHCCGPKGGGTSPAVALSQSR
jgi:hypothetical protein